MKWMNAQEKIPKNAEYIAVLMVLETGEKLVKMADNFEIKDGIIWNEYWNNLTGIYRITHWMELPALPYETYGQ